MCSGVDVFSGATALAVGSTTVAALARRGVAATSPATASSEGLLELGTLTRVAGKRVLVVTGEGGRGVLQETLAARGAMVDELCVYRRLAAQVQAPDPSTVDVIAAASGDGMRCVARLWLDAASARADVPILVPSARVAELGRQLGFTRIVQGCGASSAAVIDALRNLERRESLGDGSFGDGRDGKNQA